jgi:hypothetical protein
MSNGLREGETGYSASRDRVRAHRRRRRLGILRRTISVKDDKLDRLAVRGFLDPAKRDDPVEQTAALEAFVDDHL